MVKTGEMVTKITLLQLRFGEGSEDKGEGPGGGGGGGAVITIQNLKTNFLIRHGNNLKLGFYNTAALHCITVVRVSIV